MRQARVCEPSGEIDRLLRCDERLGANRTSPLSAALSRHGVDSLVVAPLLSCSALSRGSDKPLDTGPASPGPLPPRHAWSTGSLTRWLGRLAWSKG